MELLKAIIITFLLMIVGVFAYFKITQLILETLAQYQVQNPIINMYM